MKLLSLNVEFNKHYDTIFPFFEKESPDVICLQEVLEEDFLKLQEHIGLKGIFQAVDYETSPVYESLKGKKQGIAIFARNIVDTGSIFYAGSTENTLKSFEAFLSNEAFQNNTALLWVDIIHDAGRQFRIITTHLPVTHHGTSTPYQLEVVDSLLRTLEPLGEFVLCGDMNAPRGNESFARLAKKYKDNIPSEYQTSIDQQLHRTHGIILMVDGLFTTPTYRASNVRLMDGVSDHMAIVADVENQ